MSYLKHTKARPLLWLTMVLILLVVASVVAVYVNSAWNARHFSKAIQALEPGETVTLNDLTAFEWDAVYPIEPYTSREEIQAITGVHSAAIVENSSEAQLQLVFTKGDQLACVICGLPENLGYDLQLDGKKTPKDNLELTVSRQNGVLLLQPETV